MRVSVSRVQIRCSSALDHTRGSHNNRGNAEWPGTITVITDWSSSIFLLRYLGPFAPHPQRGSAYNSPQITALPMRYITGSHSVTTICSGGHKINRASSASSNLTRKAYRQSFLRLIIIPLGLLHDFFSSTSITLLVCGEMGNNLTVPEEGEKIELTGVQSIIRSQEVVGEWRTAYCQ